MNKKVSLLLVSIVLAIVAFTASTYIQKKAVNYIPTIKCLVANKNIDEYSAFSKEDFRVVDMPIEIVANVRIVGNYDDAEGMYLNSKIYKGQILLNEQLDSGSNLMIFDSEEGKEKISIKVKSPENGVSYIIKPGSLINVYATLNNDYALNGAFKDFEKQIIGDEYSGYSIIKVLSQVKVLETFDENGDEVEKSGVRNIDTILVLASPEEASYINLIREVATFNITEI